MENKEFYQVVMDIIQKLNSKDVYLFGLDFELYSLLELEFIDYEEDKEKILFELVKVAYNRSSFFFRYGKLNPAEIENILIKMEKSNIREDNEKLVRLIESVHPLYRKEVSDIYFNHIKDIENDIPDFPSDLPDVPF